MNEITTIGLDTAKSVFQVHGVNAEGDAVVRRHIDWPTFTPPRWPSFTPPLTPLHWTRSHRSFFTSFDLGSTLPPNLNLGDGMEWLWSIVTAIVGWLLGLWQSAQDRKRGVEEGAQAAFDMELALVGWFLLERDQKRLKAAFKDVDLTDTKQVRDVAEIIGNIYAEIIRREAFNDARVNNVSPHDRESWRRAFDEDMPPVGYEQGYLQGIRDVLKGASKVAPDILHPDALISFELWAKRERNIGFSWVDGKSIGRQLMIYPSNLTHEAATDRKSASEERKSIDTLSDAWAAASDENNDPERSLAALDFIIVHETEEANLKVAHYNRANIKIRQGRIDEALTDLTRCIGYHHYEALTDSAYARRTEIHETQLTLSAAIDECTQELCVWEGSHFAYYYRAAAHVLNGDKESAVADYTGAIRHAPDSIKSFERPPDERCLDLAYN